MLVSVCMCVCVLGSSIMSCAMTEILCIQVLVTKREKHNGHINCILVLQAYGVLIDHNCINIHSLAEV